MSVLATEQAADRVIDVVLDAAPAIRSAQVERRDDAAAGENPSGEQRIAADVAADRHLVEALADVDGVGQVASEEREDVVDAGTGLSVAIDPLDGSSNLATNNPTGTVVGVYDAGLPARGRDLVAAAIVVYGPSTIAYVAGGGDVVEYEVTEAERRVRDADVALPAEPAVVGMGGGDDDWPEPVADVADDLRHDLKLRYSGALVADVSQVLTRGGLFAYPQLRSSPQGKLRHQFEVAPVAYLIESAGGASTDGTESLLDRPPADLHARSPIYVGNESVIERVEDRLGGTDVAARGSGSLD